MWNDEEEFQSSNFFSFFVLLIFWVILWIVQDRQTFCLYIYDFVAYSFFSYKVS